jgi:DNA repair protein RadA/Sms
VAKKDKIVYVCNACGYQSTKWQGKCPQCAEWNTFEESIRETSKGKGRRSTSQRPPVRNKAVRLNEIAFSDAERVTCGIAEFDRVLGGGILPAAVILIAGEPGIGKSTLMLQAASAYCSHVPDKPVLYVSGEESLEQLRIRARRLGIDNDNLLLLAETDVDEVIAHCMSHNALAIIIDSIQTMFASEVESVPGSVAQLRECSARLVQMAKEHAFPLFLIGHVTKSGAVAGPRMLEHLVDAVIYFEGESQFAYRVLRVIKNRFGPANEVGVFEMKSEGLVEVENPAGIFIEQRARGVAGSIIAPVMEGSRPMLVEVQALTSYNGGFGAPRRSTSGVDYRRTALIIAVLEKRCGYRLYDQDVFVNVAGGIRIDEPAADLPVALAVVSSFRNRDIEPDLTGIAEIGLAGELRPVRAIDRRLEEAARLGFKKCIISHHQKGTKKFESSLRILKAKTLNEAVDLTGMGL